MFLISIVKSMEKSLVNDNSFYVSFICTSFSSDNTVLCINNPTIGSIIPTETSWNRLTDIKLGFFDTYYT